MVIDTRRLSQLAGISRRHRLDEEMGQANDMEGFMKNLAGYMQQHETQFGQDPRFQQLMKAMQPPQAAAAQPSPQAAQQQQSQQPQGQPAGQPVPTAGQPSPPQRMAPAPPYNSQSAPG